MAYTRKDLVNEQLSQAVQWVRRCFGVLQSKIKKWRFRILKKIVTLGKMQRELIDRGSKRGWRT